MSETDTPKAQPLTAEEKTMIDAAWEKHKAAGPVAKVISDDSPGWTFIVETAPDVMLDIGAPLYSLASMQALAQERDAARADVAALRQALDQQASLLAASRAETEAVRAENAKLSRSRAALAQQWAGGVADLAELRSLAAELVEGLRLLHDDVAEYARINNLGGYDNHVMKLARALIAKARAAGIPEDRTPRVCPKCKTLVRGDDRHACAPEGEKGEG